MRVWGEVAEQAEREGWGFERYLHQLAEIEVEERRVRRIERLRKRSGLPHDKTLSTLELARLPAPVRRRVPTLCDGAFVERAENLLAFGLPGRGKTHLLSAIGHELVERGIAVLFVPAFKLVQRLLAAKRELELEVMLKRLDRFELVILDDIGYVQQNREEMEVLFNLSRRALRAQERRHHLQPGLLRVGQDLSGSDDHSLRHRPAGPPRDHPRAVGQELPR